MDAAEYRMMSEATGQRIAAALEALSGFGAYLTTADVVDNLTSTDPTKVLAAPQGKALNDKLDKIKYGYINNISISTEYGGEFYTDVTISHGLGAVPSGIVVTPFQNGAVPSNYISSVIVSVLNENGAIVRLWSKAQQTIISLYWIAFK